MVLKSPLWIKTSLAIGLLSIPVLFYWFYESPPITKSVHLREFLSGVSFSERMRLKLKEILVREVDVKNLFQKIEQKEPSTWEYYSGKKNELTLRANSEGALETLRRTLATQRTDQLKVVLQDDRDTFLRRVFPDRFKREVEITILPDDLCEEITRVIYDNISLIIKDLIHKEGQTDKHFDLDEVFDKLLRDKIEPYIDSLDAVKKADPCFKTFQLLKWIRGEDVPGFAFGEYEINRGLQELLDTIANTLIETRSSWERYNLGVKIVGYTDPVLVKKAGIDLRTDKTGIVDWSNIENPLDVHYAGCNNDNVSGNTPVYIAFMMRARGKVGPKIIDNCELGAVRAYVATVYLMIRLGRSGVTYSYATGGISSSPNNDDAKKRKIDIEFTIKAARQNPRG